MHDACREEPAVSDQDRSGEVASAVGPDPAAAGEPSPAWAGERSPTGAGAGVLAADLVQTVLDAEAERHLAQSAESKQVMFPDDLLPGVGAKEMSLKEGLAKAGKATFVVCLLLSAMDGFQLPALSILAPNMRDTFGVSNGTMTFIAAASGSFLVLGAVPMGWLADRYHRGRILGVSALIFTAMSVVSGLALNAFMFFCARLGVGVAQSSTVPVSGSLQADTYPIGVRGRIAAATGFVASALGALSPILVGAVASAGGGSGWRWAFILLGLPVAVVGVFAFRLHEAPRGQNEMMHVLGQVVHHDRPVPPSLEAAFARILQIRTLKTTILAFSALGFGLFTVPVLSNLFMQDHFGLDAFKRGVVVTITGVGALLVLPFIGRYYDRLYRQDPARALRLIGFTLLPAALLTPVQYFMPNIYLFTLLAVPQAMLMIPSYYILGAVLQSVVPYRLRGMGTSVSAVYTFFIGATGGALLAALLESMFNVRVAIIVLIIPSTLIGGSLIIRSAGFIRADLSMVVAELQEELEEHERQEADPEGVPVIQVSHIDYSYGQVQVLFDVGCEVHRSEVLALLGTNGAGKSTVLRAIAGLGMPSRGVVRLHGQNITFASPEQRVRMGIQLLPGGKGVFPDMTVVENLEMGSFIYRSDPADRQRRMDRVFDLFPSLAARRGALAGSMSGGEQQMLALARVLLHDPEVLIVDELSLGLAPIVVQELIRVVERLKADGMTIIVVEQSLNVAAAIADRAVFMEKGRVLFDGPIRELVERDDLARAVFLGHEGG
jgi:ABC-type branched-subunit amino acid transport system ATPase component/predicted MFS family arabinose efflux permease